MIAYFSLNFAIDETNFQIHSNFILLSTILCDWILYDNITLKNNIILYDINFVCVNIFLSGIYIFKIIFINERMRAYMRVIVHNDIMRKYDNPVKFSKWNRY